MKVLIESPYWLGDAIMASASIRKIIKRYKGEEIYIISFSQSALIFEHNPHIRKILILEKNFYKILSKYPRQKFELFVGYRKTLHSRFLALLLNANEKFLFNRKNTNSIHQVEKYNEFTNYVLKETSRPLPIKIYHRKESNYQFKSRTVAIAPGAKYGEAKCWPPRKYAELVLMLPTTLNFVFLGSKSELRIFDEIERILLKKKFKNFTNLIGQTTLKDLIEIISKVDILISGDSGPMHVAAAFKTPTIAIFGPTKANETSPWRNQNAAVVSKQLDCQPCMKRVCPLGHHDCMELISVNEVAIQINKKL